MYNKAAQQKCRSTERFKLARRIKRRAAYAQDGSKEKAQNRKSRLRARDAVIKYYGNKCACCGETNKGFLTADHIDRQVPELSVVGKKLGHSALYAYLIRMNFPPGYQLLCANCNLGQQWWGVCPHKKEPY